MKAVIVLSTIHDDTMCTVSQHNRHATRGTESVQKPTMIAQYNQYMGGVDKADQLVTYYGFSHYSKKW